MSGPLHSESGYDSIMAEVERQCTIAGDPDAARFYSWSQKGLWRVQDRSESGPVDIGANRDDMQEAVELDVASYVRLRARRAAIGGDGEPDWSLAIHPLVRHLLAYVGVNAAVPRDVMDVPCGWRGGMRVDNVTHVRGCVLSWIHLGEVRGHDATLEAYMSSVDLRIAKTTFPDTLRTAMVGRPLSEVMPHPVIDRIGVEILGSETVESFGGGDADTIIRLRPTWQPLVEHHDTPRPWLIPGDLPFYQ